MKIRFTEAERTLIHRLFDFLSVAEKNDREKKRSLQRVANRFYGKAPETALKPEEATLVFVAVNYALQRDKEKNHPHRAHFQTIVNKLTPALVKESGASE